MMLPQMVMSQYRFRHLDIEDGLSENAITDIFQDHHGYMWFATQDGLNKYDGYQFTNYSSSGKTGESLSDNFLWGIVEDEIGNIWCGSRYGLNKIDPVTGNISYYLQTEDALLMSQNQISSTAYLDGYVYACFQKQIAKIPVKESASLDLIIDSNYLLSHTSPKYGLLTDPINHKVFAVGFDGIEDLGNGKKFAFDQPQDDRANALFHSHFNSETNDNWFTNSQKVFSYHPGDEQVKTLNYDFNDAVIYDITFEAKDIWIATSNGIYILSDQGVLIDHITHKATSDYELSATPVECIFTDVQGSVWAGAAGKGLNQYNPRIEQFKFLDYNCFGQDEIVRSACRIDSSLIVATSSGLFELALKKPEEGLTAFNFSNNGISSTTKIEFDGFPDVMFNHVHPLKNGQIILGTKNHGILLTDQDLNLLQAIELECPNSSVNVITDVLEASSGNIWITSFQGCFEFTSEFEPVAQYSSRDSSSGLNVTYLLNIFESANKEIWLGSNLGIHRFNGTSFKNYEFNVNQMDQGPGFNFISGFAEIEEGTLWIGTYGGGLSKMDLETESFRHFTTQNGLINNVVNGIQIGPDNQIWLSSNRGISSFNVETESFLNFTQANGVHFNEFNLNANYSWKGQELYFGTPKSLVVFNPLAISPSSFSPNVVITSFDINYENANERMLNNQVELYPGDDAISIHFAGLNFNSTSSTAYRFRLNGYKDEWVYPESNNLIASYTSLSSGSYEFEVQCTNDFGFWSKEIKQLRLVIHPPFYRTWWFLTLAIIGLLLIITLVIRYLSQVKMKKKLQAFKITEEVQKQKQKISRDLHDNIGAQITYLISSIDQESYKNPDEVATFDELGEKARNVMTELRQTIWVMNKDEISPREFEIKVQEYVAKILREHPMVPTVNLNLEGGTKLAPNLVSNLFRILQESLNNAVKHAAATQFIINLTAREDSFEMTLEDNGVGMGYEEIPDDHFGLKNMKFRVEEMNGIFEIKSPVQNSGTIIYLKIPN